MSVETKTIEQRFIEDYDKQKKVIKKQRELIKDLRESLEEAKGKDGETIRMIKDSIEYFHVEYAHRSDHKEYIKKQDDPLAFVAHVLSNRPAFEEYLETRIRETSYGTPVPFRIQRLLGWFQFRKYDLHYIGHHRLHYSDDTPELDFVKVDKEYNFTSMSEAREYAEEYIRKLLERIKEDLESGD